mgnify:CR=1 FL=1
MPPGVKHDTEPRSDESTPRTGRPALFRRRPLIAARLQLLHIEEILRPCDGAFIADKVLARNKVDRLRTEGAGLTPRPRPVKIDSEKIGEDIHLDRRFAKGDAVIAGEYFRFQLGSSGAGFLQGGHGPFGVVFGGTNTDVEVFGHAHMTVIDDGPAADDQEIDAVFVERGHDPVEIVRLGGLLRSAAHQGRRDPMTRASLLMRGSSCP